MYTHSQCLPAVVLVTIMAILPEAWLGIVNTIKGVLTPLTPCPTPCSITQSSAGTGSTCSTVLLSTEVPHDHVGSYNL